LLTNNDDVLSYLQKKKKILENSIFSMEGTVFTYLSLAIFQSQHDKPYQLRVTSYTRMTHTDYVLNIIVHVYNHQYVNNSGKRSVQIFKEHTTSRF